MKIELKDQEEIKKLKDKQIVKYYYNLVNKEEPIFLLFQGTHPDVLLKEEDDIIAFELVRYFKNVEEQNDVQYRSEINKYLGYNLLKSIVSRVSKKENEVITISYSKKNKMISDILDGIVVIDMITIENNHWFRDGKESLILNDKNLKTMTLADFLKYFDHLIKNGKSIMIRLIENKKSKISTEVHFQYNDKVLQKEDIEITKTYIGPYNEDVTIENIVESIKSKLEKYNSSVNKMKINRIKYDKYKLLVHYLRIPAFVDHHKLYEKIMNEVDISKFDEVIIVLSKKVLILKNDKFEVVDCN